MATRTRLPDLLAKWRTQAEAEAAVAEARRVVERWNAELAAGRHVWWSPTIRAAIVAALASVGSLVLGLPAGMSRLIARLLSKTGHRRRCC